VNSKNCYEAVIDGNRVNFRRGIGWICSCETYRSQSECEHTIKAAALLTWGRPMTANERREGARFKH
jgi:hypothetical protein